MYENKYSGADALTEELSGSEFYKILDCTVEELLEKAWQEKWTIKHIEFWLNVKNSQNLERLAKKLPVMT